MSLGDLVTEISRVVPNIWGSSDFWLSSCQLIPHKVTMDHPEGNGSLALKVTKPAMIRREEQRKL